MCRFAALLSSLCLFLTSAQAVPTGATDLASIYRQALSQDPQFHAALYQLQADHPASSEFALIIQQFLSTHIQSKFRPKTYKSL